MQNLTHNIYTLLEVHINNKKKITAEEESNPKNKKEPTKQNHPISICKTKMQNLTHYRHSIGNI